MIRQYSVKQKHYSKLDSRKYDKAYLILGPLLIEQQLYNALAQSIQLTLFRLPYFKQ